MNSGIIDGRCRKYNIANKKTKFRRYILLMRTLSGCQIPYGMRSHHTSTTHRQAFALKVFIARTDVLVLVVQARLECRDGCNIAVLRCQPGYSCADGVMTVCQPGTYRNASYDMIMSCLEVRSEGEKSNEKVVSFLTLPSMGRWGVVFLCYSRRINHHHRAPPPPKDKENTNPQKLPNSNSKRIICFTYAPHHDVRQSRGPTITWTRTLPVFLAIEHSSLRHESVMKKPNRSLTEAPSVQIGSLLSQTESPDRQHRKYPETIDQCPRGTYRGQEKGRGVDDCDLCPVHTYQNITGATSEKDCIRCPDGQFAEMEGTSECRCMTEDSCLPEWQNYQRDSMPYVGRQ